MTMNSPRPWSIDTRENQCGDGPVLTWCVVDADGKVIFDALNADDAEVYIEGDDDPEGAIRQVDLLSKVNAEWIVAAVNAFSQQTTKT
jgi:hypothetical protein